MYQLAVWVTDNPIVIPFIIAGLAFVVFHAYMFAWGIFESAVGVILSTAFNAIKYLVVKIKNANWVTPHSITWR